MKKSPIREQRRQHWEHMKDRPFLEKAGYLLTYYRNHALLLLAVLAALAYTVYEAATTKDTALHVTFLGIWLQEGLDAESIGQEFLSFGGLNPQKQQIVLDMNMHPGSDGGMSIAVIQKLAMDLSSGEMDVLVTTDTWIRQNRDKGMFADLSEILPQELLAAHQDKIYYLNSTVDDKGEFPVGIDVSQSSLMLSPDLPAYFCIAANVENKDNAVLFLRYLLERQDGREKKGEQK